MDTCTQTQAVEIQEDISMCAQLVTLAIHIHSLINRPYLPLLEIGQTSLSVTMELKLVCYANKHKTMCQHSYRPNLQQAQQLM